MFITTNYLSGFTGFGWLEISKAMVSVSVWRARRGMMPVIKRALKAESVFESFFEKQWLYTFNGIVIEPEETEDQLIKRIEKTFLNHNFSPIRFYVLIGNKTIVVQRSQDKTIWYEDTTH
jgi:hypothetical protein